MDELLTLTADIVSAHVSNNTVAANDVPAVVTAVYGALAGLGRPVEEVPAKQEPAVSIRSSVKPDYIVCLEDGKKLKLMKPYLSRVYGMTPDQYRQKWGLQPDYPMTAPAYSESRRAMAKAAGLGAKGRGRGKAAAKPATKATGRAEAGEGAKPARPRRKRAETPA